MPSQSITLPQDAEVRQWLSLIDKKATVPIYLVGGIVRDSLLGKPSTDFDVVMEQDALLLARQLAETIGGETVTHDRFRTATWYPPQFNGHIDLISARSETYSHSAALPTITLSDLQADALRRDISINTLRARYADNSQLNVDDPCGGLADLEAGIIRVLHDSSFIDDPTRIFRVIRYAGRFGFRFEPKTERLLRAGSGAIDLLSGARVWHELERIADEPKRGEIFTQLAKFGVLEQVTAGLRWDASIAAIVQAAPLNLGLEAWLAGNEAGLLSPLQERLALPNEVVDVVREAQAVVDALHNIGDDSPKPSVLTRLIESTTSSEDALAVAGALTHHTHESRWVTVYQSDWAAVSPEIDGHYLREMGVAPGPIYGEILGQLRAGVLDGEIRGLAQERAVVKRVLDG